MFVLKNSKVVNESQMVNRVLSDNWVVFQYFDEINDLFSLNILRDLLSNYNDGPVETHSYMVGDETKTFFAVNKSNFEFTVDKVKDTLVGYVSLLIKEKVGSKKGEIIIPHKPEDDNAERKYLFTETDNIKIYVSKIKYLALFDGQNIMLFLRDLYLASNGHSFENGNYRIA